jgi:hypothetical protein
LLSWRNFSGTSIPQPIKANSFGSALLTISIGIMRQTFRSLLFWSLLAEKGLKRVLGHENSPAPPIPQRLLFSSAYHSSACHSPAPPILQRLPFSSARHSPASAILQRLPFSSDCHSPALPFSALPFSGHHFLQSLPFGVSIPLVPELRASHKRACHGLPTPSSPTLASL